jgi:hypothetical protein
MSSAEIKSVLWLSLCLTMAACSSGGGESTGDTESPDDSDPVPAEGAPTVTVESSTKQLQFNWNAQEGDAYYILSGNPGNASGFTDIADEEDNKDTTQTIPVAVHHHKWADAAYIVEACTASDKCVPSLQVTTEDAMLGAIGYFKASNPGAGDEFGQSVALSDDGRTLAVGAHYEQSSNADGTQNDERPGAVYIFTLSESGWIQEASIKALEVTGSNDFGHDIALSADGNTLVIGATSAAYSTEGNVQHNTGAAYVLVHGDDGWTHQSSVHASNARAGGRFGISVDLSDDGNMLAVGSPGESSAAMGVGGDGSDDTAPSAGAVYLFARTDGNWTQTTYIKASNTDAGDLFGYDLALSGDGTTLAAGAYQESSNATGVGGDESNDASSQAGAVYVFSQTAGVWSQQSYLKASASAANAQFGYALTISDNGDLLAVAVGNKDQNLGDQNREAGAVDVFTRAENNWTHQTRLTASNTASGDSFGADLTFNNDGSLLAVGASWEDSAAAGIGGDQNSNLTPNAGAVYLFALGGSDWTQVAYVKAPNPQAHSFFGHSVALDASGDTLAVGAIHEDGASPGVGGDQAAQTAADAGAVYLY